MSSKGLIYFMLFLALSVYVEGDSSAYYINITEKILTLTALPFHYTSTLLDDSILIEGDKKWISTYENGGSCINARCSKDTESCFNVKAFSEITADELEDVSSLQQRFLSDSTGSSSSDDAVYMLMSDICADNQFCDINVNMNGVCTNYSAYIEKNLLLVGQECTDDMYWSICGYGKMQCSDSKCAPIDSSMLCQTSNDCWTDQFCNTEGKCVTPKKPGEACIDQEECGRTGACYFSDLRNKQGECVGYFSKMTGETVATYTGHDNMFGNKWNVSNFMY